MSKFYGTVIGQAATSATRRGSENSGIRTAAQSYDGSVQVSLRYNDEGQLEIRLTCSDNSSVYGDKTLYDGSFEGLKKVFDLLNDIKSGKVSTTRHRAKSNKMKQLERLFG